MDTNPNADDAVTASRPAGTDTPKQIMPSPPPEPADAAIQDGQAPAFVLPRNPIAAFFAGPPIGFWFFFWGEFAERCSYYGMRAILALYMAEKLGLGEANAATFNSFFIAACYFLPLLGGYVADRWFGKYWTIVGFSIPYILGHVILGVENFWFMVAALSLLAMGSGVIKPNISTLMGLTYDQQRPGQEKLRSDGFAMFYFSINVGAALSQFAMPVIRDHWGYAIAFLFPAALMVLSFAIFAAGKPFYAKETPGTRAETTPEQRKERWALLGRIGALFILVMFFWSIFDQASSTWIFFANVHMDLRLFGYVTDPDQIQALNPVYILILLPLITVLFKYLDARGLKIRATDKMVVGFLLTAGCMAVMALAGFLAGPSVHAPRLALKNGDVSFSRGRLVFNHSTVEIRDGVISSKDDKHALKSGIAVFPDDEVPLPDSWPAQEGPGPQFLNEKQAAIQRLFDGSGVGYQTDGSIAVNSGKVFFENATVLADGEIIGVTDGKTASADLLAVGSVGLLGSPTGPGPLLAASVLAPEKVAHPTALQPAEYATVENKVSVWWQVLAYLIITVAEVLISVTGLELAYAAAPKSMTGFVTACWLMTVALGNLFINAPVARLYTAMPPGYYFAGLAVTLLVVTVAFFFVAIIFNRGMKPAAADGIPLPGPADDDRFEGGDFSTRVPRRR